MLFLCGLSAFLVAYGGSVLFLALPAISADFHAPLPALSNLGSVLAVGVLAALPLSVAADRYGRRRLIAAGVGGFSIANLLSGFAQDLTGLAVARAVAVAFEAAVGGVATTLLVEELPAERRGLGVGVLTLAAGMGGGLTTVAYPLVAPRWRLLYVAGGAGLLAVPLLLARLPESRRWRSTTAAGPVLRLLWQPPWRRRLLVLAISAALGALLYEPAALFGALFASRVGLPPPAISVVVVLSGIAAGAGFLAGGWASDRRGRRALAAWLSFAGASAAAATFGFGAAGYWAGNLAWSLLAGAAGPVIAAWLAELFPTRARATSEAVASVAAAIGGVAGLQLLAAIAAATGLGRALVLLSAAALAGALLLLLLPETRRLPLPD